MSEKKQKNFKKSDWNFQDFFDSLEQVCDGLIYVSEIDSTVKFFEGSLSKKVTESIILKETGKSPNELIEEVSFSDFFARLTANKEWHGERETERARKFLDLQKLIEEYLSNYKVFRVGNIRLEIYVVGLTNEGRLSGVMIEAVET